MFYNLKFTKLKSLCRTKLHLWYPLMYINNKVKVKGLLICFSGCCLLTIGFRDSLASSASSSSSASLALLNPLLVWWTSTWWSLMTSIGGWLCWQPPLCLLCLWKVCESVWSLELLGLELLCCCLACADGNSDWAAGGSLLILQYNVEVTLGMLHSEKVFSEWNHICPLNWTKDTWFRLCKSSCKLQNAEICNLYSSNFKNSVLIQNFTLNCICTRDWNRGRAGGHLIWCKLF